MEFEEISKDLQETFLRLYKENLNICESILEDDRWIYPILRINSASEPKLISMQSQDNKADFDIMIKKVKEILNSQSFDTASLSYSSSSVLKNSDALVTYLVDKSGVGALYFTAYHFKGLLKKKVIFDKHLLGAVIDNAL